MHSTFISLGPTVTVPSRFGASVLVCLCGLLLCAWKFSSWYGSSTRVLPAVHPTSTKLQIPLHARATRLRSASSSAASPNSSRPPPAPQRVWQTVKTRTARRQPVLHPLPPPRPPSRSPPPMIYIDTNAHRNTGGPEALIQLALTLGHRNISMFPTSLHGRFVQEYPGIRYLKQAVPHANLTHDDIVILSEVQRCTSFGDARVFIWLLSSNNNYMHKENNTCTYIAHDSAISRMFGGVPIIRPYITPSTVQFCRQARRSSENRRLILIDNDAPSQLWKLGTVVRGYARPQVMHMLSQARYIIDWKFVGSERMPIEGLLCGAYVLTSRHPENSALGSDFMFPNQSFVDTYDDIIHRIREKRNPPHMTKAIAEFEALGPNTMWNEAQTAFRI